jgi:uncharacterized hydrophobic protein (TIGR00271 family)
LSILPGALRTLVVGVVSAVIVASLLWWLAGLVGLATGADASQGAQTDFIVKPDIWSFLIALLAGVAGVLALTTSKSGPLVGVFISVTTVPAAGNVALGLAFGARSEVVGSGVQLALNVSGMILAGWMTLALQQAVWNRMARRRERALARRPR